MRGALLDIPKIVVVCRGAQQQQLFAIEPKQARQELGRRRHVVARVGHRVVIIPWQQLTLQAPEGIPYRAVGIESARTSTQRLHVVAELRDTDAPPEAQSRLVREIVQRVHRARGHRPAKVLLVRPGTIPKTSSGKIQHTRLARMIAEDELGDRLVYASGVHH